VLIEYQKAPSGGHTLGQAGTCSLCGIALLGLETTEVAPDSIDVPAHRVGRLSGGQQYIGLHERD